jgi:hypothetical protein
LERDIASETKERENELKKNASQTDDLMSKLIKELLQKIKAVSDEVNKGTVVKKAEELIEKQKEEFSRMQKTLKANVTTAIEKISPLSVKSREESKLKKDYADTTSKSIEHDVDSFIADSSAKRTIKAEVNPSKDKTKKSKVAQPKVQVQKEKTKRQRSTSQAKVKSRKSSYFFLIEMY